MVRTGKRAAALAQILAAGKLKLARNAPAPPRLESLAEQYREQVLGAYRVLGGIKAVPNLRPGPWDLTLADGRVLEFDEELHFNRYRSVTLRELPHARLPWHAAYCTQCVVHEAECLRAGRWGSRWDNPSASAMFGPAAEPGELSVPAGAPRWKQRALYDALKDTAAAQDGGPVLVRVSVHDVVAGTPLGAMLEGRSQVSADDVVAFVESRTARP